MNKTFEQEMTFEDAVEHYTKACEEAFGHTLGLQMPRKSGSDQDKSGRWILRNTKGFLAYVTNTGKVLDAKFQPIGE